MNAESNYLPIEDYGLIGNLQTGALISKTGSIDYLPFHQFDAPLVLGSLLDSKNGGYFSVEPESKDINHKQLYLPDTAVLLTRYLAEDGIAELTDFMPPVFIEDKMILVRKLKVIKGAHTFLFKFKPGFNFGQTRFDYQVKKDRIIISTDHGEKLILKSNLEFTFQDGEFTAKADLKTKDEVFMVLISGDEEDSVIELKPTSYFTKKLFTKTINFWHKWIKKSSYKGKWQEVVNRAAITLKLLTSYTYGSTIAAATLGLPEVIGGNRNWDYRYTWIRDAAFTMRAFLQLGYMKEAKHFIDWIEDRCNEINDAGDLKLMYQVDGGTNIEEKSLEHLEGYKKSSPVRTGNGAFNQFQLDIYGELIDTIYLYNKHGGPISYEFWMNLKKFVDFVCDNWQTKDRGMWEVRDEKREFLISKVMSWVAIDRGIRIAEHRSFPAPLEEWRKTRDRIYDDFYNNYWNPELKAFVQFRGSKNLDASSLLIPLVRILSPKEPRWISTLNAIEKDLVTDTLVYRYRLDEGASDGFSGQEGTFSMCSFWYIECLASSGDRQKAVLAFEKMLGYSNHLGLYSEQISMKGEQLGNFPQAFTHLGLISAALQLSKTK
ncbi:glycoside hydrolase family 15 protein [Saccharicrinis sp. FJH54]|uniref:glycoside hydrolase family 15 protein n=1 Tax=Saccharicrinis sp. FJH54 TaxID=3344665 RepID=UPI0035D4BD40